MKIPSLPDIPGRKGIFLKTIDKKLFHCLYAGLAKKAGVLFP